jgi:hypothetical protein
MISLEELANRDIKQEIIAGKYQILSSKTYSCAQICFLEKPSLDICLYDDKSDKLKWSFIQYSLSDDDIDNKRFYMIGYLIKNKNNYPIGSLIFSFLPYDMNNINFNNPIKGSFEIILSNNKNEHKIIETFDKYPGNDESIILLSEKLKSVMINIIEDNI